MKYLLPLIFCCVTFTANATIHVVSNDPNNPAQYATLQDAHDAALPGDTISVTPSPLEYQSLTMNRPLVIMGDGYVSEDLGSQSFSTRIRFVYCNDIGTSSSSGSTFQNIEIGALIPVSIPISNIVIKECQVGISGGSRSGGDGVFDNFNISHSIIEFIGQESRQQTIFHAQSGIITNSVIASIVRIGLSSDFSDKPDILVRNCVIVDRYNMFKVQDIIFENNVFVELDIDEDDIRNSTFTNNIFFNSTGDALPLAINNNAGAGNLLSTNPMFEGYDIVVGAGSDLIDTEDYHLKSTSPGKFYGTDGTDVGIYGGSNPFPEGPYDGKRPVPTILLFNLLNAIVGPNGQLSFEVEATSGN